MKKFFMILLAAVVSLTASAQYADTDLTVKGGCVYADGVRLSDDQAAACFRNVYGIDRSADYIRYAKGYRRGLGMTIAGGTAFVAGGTVFAVGFSKILMKGIGGAEFNKAQTMAIASSFVTLGGAVVTLVGIPTLTRNSSRLHDLAAYRNDDRSLSPEISLGPTENGVGFALRF